MLYALLIVPIMTAAMIRQRVSRDALEGSLIAYLAPIAYAMGLWLFMNWLVLGDAIAFLHGGVPKTGANVNPTSHPGSTPVPALAVPKLPVRHIVDSLVTLNWQLFLPTLIVMGALLLAAVVRRDLMALALVAAIGTNAFTTFLLMTQSGQDADLQLRYNMRAMPLSIIGICWLYGGWRRQATRTVVAVAGIVVVALAIPRTWHMMDTFPYQYGEQAFTRAVGAGEDMQGKAIVRSYVMGVKPDQEIAAYIDRHIRKRDAIITDDAQSLTVMLLSGHPDYFFDRIDEGDARWYEAARGPFGRFRYALVTVTSMPVQVNGFILDWMRFVWPNLVVTPHRATPGFTLIYENSRYRLYEIAKRKPVVRPALVAKPV
jgi:hypothetical protein